MKPQWLWAGIDWVVLGAVVIIGCCPSAATPIDPDPVAPSTPEESDLPPPTLFNPPLIEVERVSWPVVHILVEGGGRGTGVIVGQDGDLVYVVSALHVFNRGDNYVEPQEVVVLNPELVKLTGLSVALFDADRDIVVLLGSAEGYVFEVARIADGPPTLFDPVVSAGTFPGWPDPMVFRGHVTSVGRDNIIPIVTSTAFPGASGGPIYLYQEDEWKLWAITVAIPMVCLNGVCDHQANTHLVSPVVDFLRGIIP